MEIPIGNKFNITPSQNMVLSDGERKFTIQNLGNNTSALSAVANESGNILLGSENGAHLFSLQQERTISSYMTGESGQKNEIPSAVFGNVNANMIYAAFNNQVLHYDTRSKEDYQEKGRRYFDYNSEEINQLCVSGKYLAASDDSGEIVVYDTIGQKPFRKLRKKHQNICSTVSFWEKNHISGKSCLLSGGLDCQLFLWDKERVKTLSHSDTRELSSTSNNDSSCMLSPPMIFDIDCLRDGSLVSSGLGNGSIILYEITKKCQLEPLNILTAHSSLGVSCTRLCTYGDHIFLFSGGNDCKVNIWKFPYISTVSDIKVCQLEVHHQQIELESKVAFICPYIENNDLFLLACDQSPHMIVYKIET